MKHTRRRKSTRKTWMAAGAFAASAVVAGRPVTGHAAMLPAGRTVAPERVAISRLQHWPEFLAERPSTAPPSRYAAPAPPALAEPRVVSGHMGGTEDGSEAAAQR